MSHAIRYHPGRPSLGCDLIKPLRVPAVDRWVLKLCNENHLKPEHFVPEGKGVQLQPDIFRQVLVSWEEHWLTSKNKQELHRGLEYLVELLRQRTPLLADFLESRGENDL